MLPKVGGSKGKGVLAHRLSYQIHKGEIPEGMVVMHSCDNPSCVNPDHLSIGTQSQNIKEAIAKGRKVLPKLSHPSGADHPCSKLTEENVIEIRSSPMMDTVYAKRFGVSPATVRRARIGMSWGNITP